MLKRFATWIKYTGMIIKAAFAKDKEKSLNDSIEKLSTEELFDISLFSIDSVFKDTRRD